ncbi:MAG: TfoX/Sxy family protein [Eggerthellaceae bacterium]|nr:TfoX/Sxy family protein [Eggerthellaceae bacterium]
MASSPEFRDYVLDLLRDVPDVICRKMMGEYLLYAEGRLFGGIYDDRFLVKDTPASRALLPDTQIPYEGAAPMRVVDRESAADVAELVIAMVPELPTPKTRKR